MHVVSFPMIVKNSRRKDKGAGMQLQGNKLFTSLLGVLYMSAILNTVSVAVVAYLARLETSIFLGKEAYFVSTKL